LEDLPISASDIPSQKLSMVATLTSMRLSMAG
jgi:hypothetical protein